MSWHQIHDIKALCSGILLQSFLAIHPKFVENGWFFVNYTDSSGHTVVARIQASPEAFKADPNSLQVILRFEQPFANHNGGGLAFGPDGYLYIGTGGLYIGDVGQNKWEELNFQPAQAPGGANYGWNLRIGAHPFTSEITEGLTEPVAEYSHSQGCSVMGGVVVCDTSLPEWNGVYLYGDFCSGAVWGLIHQADGSWQSAALFNTNFRISSFGEAWNAQVYLLYHRGAIYRLERAP